jgi:hypothetical protein
MEFTKRQKAIINCALKHYNAIIEEERAEFERQDETENLPGWVNQGNVAFLDNVLNEIDTIREIIKRG